MTININKKDVKKQQKGEKNEVEYFHQCIRKYLLRVSRVLKSKANL